MSAPSAAFQRTDTEVIKGSPTRKINALWWTHFVLRCMVIGFLTTMLTPLRNGAIEDLNMYYVKWDRAKGNPPTPDSNCGELFGFDYHTNPSLCSNPATVCLDEDIWVAPLKTIFKKKDKTTGTISYLGDPFPEEDVDGCTVKADQCCGIMRGSWGSNFAVVIIYFVFTLIMIFGHPSISKKASNQGIFKAGTWYRVLLKMIMFLWYVIMFAVLIATLERGPRCNENWTDAENELFGEQYDMQIDHYGALFWFSIVVSILLFVDFLGELLAFTFEESVANQEFEDGTLNGTFGRMASAFATANAPIESSIYSLPKQAENIEAAKSLYF